jgi:hypothetical protein
MMMMMILLSLDDIKMCLLCGSGDSWLLYPLRLAFRHRVIIVDRGGIVLHVWCIVAWWIVRERVAF